MALSPTALRILWHPSTAEFVSYQLFWKREGVVEGMHLQNGDLSSEQTTGDKMIKWADLYDLSPGEEYVLWVSSYIDLRNLGVYFTNDVGLH